MKRIGTSLIELLIAIGVISVVLVALTAATTSSVSVQIFAKNEAQATKLAQEQVERLRAYRDRNGWATTNALSGNKYFDIDLTIPGSSQLINNIFTVWVDPGGTCRGANTKEFDAYARWTNPKGNHESKITICLTDWR